MILTTNHKRLSQALSNRDFQGTISNNNIHDFIGNLQQTPQPFEKQYPLPPFPEEEESEPYMEDDTEYHMCEQKKSDDKFARENKELKAKNKRLENEKRTMKAELAEKHRELHQQLEDHENYIMKIETFAV